MFKKIRKYLADLEAPQKAQPQQEKYIEKDYKIEKDLQQNLTNLKNIFEKSNDIVFREFNIGDKKHTKAFLCFIDGLTDKEAINQHVIKALMVDSNIVRHDEKSVRVNVFDIVKDSIISGAEVKETTSFNTVIGAILEGDVPLFIDGYTNVLIAGSRKWEARSVEEPNTELAIRGPREGFTETLRTNTSLLRRIIRNTNLIFELYKIGKQTHTDVCIAYIDGIANKSIIDEVRNRINRIDTDAILDTGYIEQFIRDSPFSPFPTIGNSEKPVKVAAKILEGRIAILCGGTPFVLTVPHLFIENFQISEDYYESSYIATLERLLRFLSFIISLTLPAFYIAIETFHQEMIPSILLTTMAAAKEGVPFPAFIETLIMITIFEILRQSGLRIPRQVGSAVSIVGALVIGESAVRAGIISAPMVIIASLTGITSFVIPSLANSIFVLRYLLMCISAAFGLYGMTVGFIMILAYMCSLRSFGVPYLTPFAPIIWQDLKDSLLNVPLWLMKSRPKSITWRNSIRQKTASMPNPPDNQRSDDN